MRTILRSLLWKEWHEHKWKLASLVAILWGVTSIALSSNVVDRFQLAAGMLTVCVIPLSVFIGLGAASNERSRNTLPYIQALPVPMWRLAVTKLVMGLLTVLVAIIFTTIFFWLWTRGLEIRGIEYRSALDVASASGPPVAHTGNWFLDVFLFCAAMGASFYIWSAAAGVNRKDEVSAGAVALAVMVGWYVLLGLVGYAFSEILETSAPGKWLKVIGTSSAPGGFGIATDVPGPKSGYLVTSLLAAAIVHLGLAAWYLRRYGRISNLEVRSPQLAVRSANQSDWLSPPRRSAFSAIVWKQARESAPIVAAGLAGVTGIVALFVGGDPRLFLSSHAELAEIVAAVSVSLGFCVALIVGIGVFLQDAQPQINTFWRSRPINPHLWYWCKLLTGLAVLLTAVYFPLLLAVYALHPDPGAILFHPDAVNFPLAHVAIFAAAAALVCLVRHAVYAAILSIPAVYLGLLVVWIADWTAGAIGWVREYPAKLDDLTEMEIGLGFALSAVVSTIIAWLAVRYDWGRTSRY